MQLVFKCSNTEYILKVLQIALRLVRQESSKEIPPAQSQVEGPAEEVKADNSNETDAVATPENTNESSDETVNAENFRAAEALIVGDTVVTNAPSDQIQTPTDLKVISILIGERTKKHIQWLLR